MDEMSLRDEHPDTAVEADDMPLLQAAWRGDREAFTAIVERHERFVHAFLRARLTCRADADDLTQEVFVRVVSRRAVPRVGQALRLRGWLAGIARNVLREHLRRARRRPEAAWTRLCLEAEATIAGESDSDERLDCALAGLPDCLEALGPSAREAIDLYYQDDLRMAQIATRFRRSEGAVKLLVHRAREAVRRCLVARGIGGAADGG